MRPLGALLGIVLGSSVALLAGLLMTLLVFLLLPEFRERLSGEFLPLLQAVAWAMLLVGISAAAFIGELRSRRWRILAQLGLVAALTGVAWRYWPK